MTTAPKTLYPPRVKIEKKCLVFCGEACDCSASYTSHKTADRIDGYDRDDLGESPDY